MLMQEKLYDFSADYRPSSVGDYSPAVVAAAVNLCRNTASPRPLFNPYECSKYMPLYYSSKIFTEYSQLLAKPPSLLASTTVPYLTMQLPIRPPTLTRNSSVDNNHASDSISTTAANNTFLTLPVKRTLDGSIKTSEMVSVPCENQRTQSVIMKIEDQRIVEVPTNELITHNIIETEEESPTCKWVDCYRYVSI